MGSTGHSGRREEKLPRGVAAVRLGGSPDIGQVKVHGRGAGVPPACSPRNAGGAVTFGATLAPEEAARCRRLRRRLPVDRRQEQPKKPPWNARRSNSTARPAMTPSERVTPLRRRQLPSPWTGSDAQPFRRGRRPTPGSRESLGAKSNESRSDTTRLEHRFAHAQTRRRRPAWVQSAAAREQAAPCPPSPATKATAPTRPVRPTDGQPRPPAYASVAMMRCHGCLSCRRLTAPSPPALGNDPRCNGGAAP